MSERGSCNEWMGGMFKVLICGSREWTRNDQIVSLVTSLPSSTLLITGGGRGADQIAYDAAGQHIRRGGGMIRVQVKAEWERYGPSAGPRRNAEMIALRPHIVFAFPEPSGENRGTMNLVRCARRAGIPVLIYDGTEVRAYP